MMSTVEPRSSLQTVGEKTGLHLITAVPLENGEGFGRCPGKSLLESCHVLVKNVLVVIGEMEEFNTILVPAGLVGRINDTSHHIDQRILQAQGDHDLLSLGQRDVGFH